MLLLTKLKSLIFVQRQSDKANQNVEQYMTDLSLRLDCKVHDTSNAWELEKTHLIRPKSINLKSKLYHMG